MKTNAIPITAPVLPPGTNDIRGLKPPVEIPNHWPWVMAALAAVAVALVAWFAWRQWRRKLAVPPLIPIVPPHVRARDQLQQALALIAQPQPFCITVSDIVRRYLEERFYFRAPDRTTEEFLHELKATNLLLPDQKESLGEFLNVCDMVKFARYEPGLPELQALHASAVRLLDETEPQPIPTGAAAPDAVSSTP